MEMAPSTTSSSSSLEGSPMTFPSHLPPTPPLQDFDEYQKQGLSLPTDGLGRSVPPYPLPPPSRQNKVLPEDLKTPDDHVERDPRLIRLTGVHPFNVEPPLTDLFDEGFLTTKDLHYVRNHGAVPRVEDSSVLDWDFTVEGMVAHPITLTLRDLIRTYDQVTYPVTLVCAGNRRKEQNVVRKTKGFSWGAAGLSTALWTGVALPDLLARAAPLRGARYVCFEGADRLPNGCYGTSVRLGWATDPARGIMLAHRMNGEPLPPDHGKPLRVIIPGQIGGRSVKWLKRIIVTAKPSDSWYHIYDNRVLPTVISPEESADRPDVWKDERYAIYDLNTNSAICYPAHDERVPLGIARGDAATYKLRGYAYAGGGKRVTRLEVTLDQGRTWMLATMSYPEDLYRLAPEGETLFGGRLDVSWRETCFCWCFWSLDVPLSRLRDARDVMIRAMDESMMVQPRDMYWSVLGMMNNPWYRVVIHKESDTLRFEHPTQPALMPGGWMERVKKEGGNLTNGFWGEKVGGQDAAPADEAPAAKEISMVNEKVTRRITPEELRQHSGEDEPWFVVNGQVYDGTKFLEGHPGGAASIINAAGQDVSEEFLAIHSENAKAMMPSYHIGTLPASADLSEEPSDEAVSSSSAVFLQPKTWRRALLASKTAVSPDTKVFHFTLPSPAQAVGLPVGQHLLVRLRDPVTREAIIRAYTPLSEGGEVGTLRVLVKIYRDSPDGSRKGGRMTQALDSLPVGHPVEFKGPVGKFEYLGAGRCVVGGRERTVARFVMVCGGSGVTPIFAVLRAVARGERDETACLVLDGNRGEGDILLREELDGLVRESRGRCRIVHALSRPRDGWKGLKGRMDRAFFEREVGAPPAERNAMVLICGPEGMEKAAREAFLGMGWDEDDLLFF
ncbi:hypothetical protein MYCTH_2299273 [Thermothelomyces thermophilus ATCC 42464]|uniref:Nitrate reductase n=1 Tax=Thermothelomyces thermophilus (strain ATCC 42464 / BCRC 31852 / DSM 1799) TaxID=573729 RepID=G2Q594_THET4|nr:uncharacterized protein MYCTH_2299273 [Thermothelomyces thermophilus ATCC 42464]AEO55434.1 hypothetical protein MYCTH_2299273 [Thermothelomyces thermophilus ATCC 42464]